MIPIGRGPRIDQSLHDRRLHPLRKTALRFHETVVAVQRKAYVTADEENLVRFPHDECRPRIPLVSTRTHGANLGTCGGLPPPPSCANLALMLRGRPAALPPVPNKALEGTSLRQAKIFLRRGL